VDAADAEWFFEVLLECLQECIDARPLTLSAETPALVPMTRLDPNSEQMCHNMACTDYKVDISAATFGQCTCGYSRAAHDEKKVNPAKVARNSLHVTEKDSPGRPTGKQDEACANFVLDTSATAGFGLCLCGHPRTAHNTLTENPAAAALSRLNRGSVTKTEGNDVAKAPEPCSAYKLDKAASEFGMCTCGHARAVHRAAPTRVDNQLAQELARKKRHAEGDFTPQAQASGEDVSFDPTPTPGPPPTETQPHQTFKGAQKVARMQLFHLRPCYCSLLCGGISCGVNGKGRGCPEGACSTRSNSSV